MAQQAGLRFRWKPRPSPLTNLDSFGCGCGFIDFDGDGWMDLFLVGEPRCALYRNNRDGTFTDVTTLAGIAGEGRWKGVAVGDYDNDGRPDLYVSGYQCAMLLHNEGNGRFRDVTAGSGLAVGPPGVQWGTSCAFADLDGDGWPDLLVCHYVVTGGKYPWYCQQEQGVKTGCPPEAYPPEYPSLYHNNHDGTFTDVTRKAGLGSAHGKALALQFCDYDDDGRLDFYIANDGVPGDMFHNDGGGRFTNRGLQTATAYNAEGVAQSGMGVDFADYDRDGRMDMVVTAFQSQSYTLYHNQGGWFIANGSGATAMAATTRSYLGFGTHFFDYDNDGWPDLVFANGHVYDNVQAYEKEVSFRQHLLLFHNRQGSFEAVADPGDGFRIPIVGRGLAIGDWRNNGRLGLLVVDYQGEPLLLENRTPSSRHWLELLLEGTGRSSRDAVGARVATIVNGKPLLADCTNAGSYLSAMDPRIHLGLGSASTIDRLKVRWPDGAIQVLRDLAADHCYRLREGGRPQDTTGTRSSRA